MIILCGACYSERVLCCKKRDPLIVDLKTIISCLPESYQSDGIGQEPDPIAFSDQDLAEISAMFWEEGYLYLPRPLLSEAEIQPLKESIDALVAQKLPPVFIYLAPQPWQIFQRFQKLLQHFLGEDYGILPHLWAWHLDPQTEEAGWPPHRDCQGQTVFESEENGAPGFLMSLSLWIPLTDVGPDNGCMYVLPRSRERLYPQPVEAPHHVHLQDIRALPAPAGSVMGWRQDLYHWGARASHRAQTPRISLSFEFQNRAFHPLAEPLLSPWRPPCYAERLALIQQQFHKYTHMDSKAAHWQKNFGQA